MFDINNAMLLAAGLTYEIKQQVLLAFTILMLIACVAIIVVIMLQKGTNDNVGVISGSSETYYGKNKERNKEGILKKITLALFVFIIICAIIAFVVGVVVKVPEVA